MSISWH